MKQTILVIALLFVTAFSAFAQIEDEIRQSKAEKIAKGRAYLLEKFLDRDYDKVLEIKDYLLEMEDDNYSALAPIELWHILFWTKEFDALTADIKSFDSTRFVAYRNKVKPQDDQLNWQLSRRSIEDEHLLRFNLQEAQLLTEGNDFLTLFLDWVLKLNRPNNQEEWNEKSNKFLADFPDSEYDWFVRHMIREQYVEKDWGFGYGFELFSGISTGVLAKPIFGFGFGFDVLYKRFALSLNFCAMGMRTAADQWYSFEDATNLVYPKGSSCTGVMPYANLSYKVYVGKIVTLAPSVGIGYYWESYPKNEDKVNEYKELDKRFLPFLAGFNCDIGKTGWRGNYGAIRIKYECGLIGLGSGKTSTMHLFSVGLWPMKRQFKRVY